MRRKLFFFLEKLQVTRKERVTIGVLVIVLTLLGFLNLIIEQNAIYDDAYYEELERIFGERTRLLEAENEEIMARYHPDTPSAAEISDRSVQHTSADTVPAVNQTDMIEAADRLININNAGPEELQSLPGIGPAYAERIITWREENGVFETVEQLLEIRGIGPRRLESIRPLIKLQDEDEYK
jgi:comEA protein